MKIEESKKIGKDTYLDLMGWVSTDHKPGEKVYQLRLRKPSISRSAPTDYFKYTRQRLAVIFSQINSEDDFDTWYPQTFETN